MTASGGGCVASVHGVRIVVDPFAGAPSTCASLVVHAGVVDERGGSYGSLPLGWAWRERGVAGRSRSDADAAWGKRAVTVQPSFDRDHLRLDVQGPASPAEHGSYPAIDALLSEACDGEFDRSTFEAAVARLSSLHALEADDDAARFTAWRDRETLAPPWGRHRAGPRGLDRNVTPASTLRRFQQIVTSCPWTLVVSGDVDPSIVVAAVDRKLAGFRSSAGSVASPVDAPVVVEGLDLWQEDDGDPVHLGWRWSVPKGPWAECLAYPVASWLARNHVGRLMAAVRERHGLAYDVTAEVGGSRGKQWVDVWIVTSAAHVERVRSIVDEELERLRDGPTGDEFSAIVAHRRLAIARASMRPAARCDALVDDALMDRPYRSWEQRASDVDAWTCESFVDRAFHRCVAARTRLGMGPGASRP